MEIFCDVDGVIFDWNAAAIGVLRRAGVVVPTDYQPTDWDWWNNFGVSNDRFWELIHEEECTFYDVWIDPYPWADELLYSLHGYGYVSFLTRTSFSPVHTKGKLSRLNCMYPKIPVIVMTHDQKHLLAGPGRILIDDKNENVDSFRAAGGDAFLWPQPWNRAWSYNNPNRIEWLKVCWAERKNPLCV